MTADEFTRLDAAFREVFGESIPWFQLPADESEAVAIIRRAIEARSMDEIDQLIGDGEVA